jgi:hypothetical protein
MIKKEFVKYLNHIILSLISNRIITLLGNNIILIKIFDMKKNLLK